MSEHEDAVPIDELTTTDLRVGVIYGGDGVDPLNRLVGVGAFGGIRGRGSPTTDHMRLVVLLSTGREPEWPDHLDESTGVLTYYGDNHDPGRDLLDTNLRGNLILRNAFSAAYESIESRIRVPPFFYFERVPNRGQAVRFLGLAVPGTVESGVEDGLREISQNVSDGVVKNYLAKFTILDESVISRQWIDALLAGKPSVSANCPGAWRDWMEHGIYRSKNVDGHRNDRLPEDGLVDSDLYTDRGNLHAHEGGSVTHVREVVRNGQSYMPHESLIDGTCHYRIIDSDDGDVVVELSASGSEQGMLFDRERAAEIMRIMRTAFRRRRDSALEDVAPEFPDATEDLAKKLFMPKDWLQDCIELIRDRPQLVFYGPPGTGKTFLAAAIAEHLSSKDNFKIIQFHPSYSYEDFFEGFRPSKTSRGQILYDVHAGPLKVLADEARMNPRKIYTLVIDEMNRGNIAKIFGELYFLLEYRKENLSLMYSDELDPAFSLPRNLVIIGTMNTVDRSTALLDSAMRRRFAFVALHPSEQPVSGVLRQWLNDNRYSSEAADLLDALNSKISDDDFKIGPSYFMRPAALSESGIARTWRTSILPLLEEYHYGDRNIVAREYYALSEIRKMISDGVEAR